MTTRRSVAFLEKVGVFRRRVGQKMSSVEKGGVGAVSGEVSACITLSRFLGVARFIRPRQGLVDFYS